MSVLDPEIIRQLCSSCWGVATSRTLPDPRTRTYPPHDDLQRIGEPYVYGCGRIWGYRTLWQCTVCRTPWEHEDEQTVGLKDRYWSIVRRP